MKFNPDKHHRKSFRLKNYDYSQPGDYFVTICTQNIIVGAKHFSEGVSKKSIKREKMLRPYTQ